MHGGMLGPMSWPWRWHVILDVICHHHIASCLRAMLEHKAKQAIASGMLVVGHWQSCFHFFFTQGLPKKALGEEKWKRLWAKVRRAIYTCSSICISSRTSKAKQLSIQNTH